jgi:hypothetical protein
VAPANPSLVLQSIQSVDLHAVVNTAPVLALGTRAYVRQAGHSQALPHSLPAARYLVLCAQVNVRMVQISPMMWVQSVTIPNPATDTLSFFFTYTAQTSGGAMYAAHPRAFFSE